MKEMLLQLFEKKKLFAINIANNIYCLQRRPTMFENLSYKSSLAFETRSFQEHFATYPTLIFASLFEAYQRFPFDE